MLGVLAFALTILWRGHARHEPDLVARREALAGIVQARQASITSLEERLAGLRARFDALAARSGERELRNLREEAGGLAGLSGVAPVEGPGVVVELADAPGISRTDPTNTDFLIQDLDLQAIVNALWAAGAEAIAVDGQRVVSTSAIRNAGAVILLNYKVLSSPYRVEAVADPTTTRARFDASAIARRFAGWTQIYGLGFSVTEHDALSLPAYAGSVRFTHARPILD